MNSLLPTLWLAPAASAVVSWLLAGLLYGSVLALITWALIRWPLRRLPTAIHGLLWLIVLVKFIVPDAPGVSFSLATLVQSATGWSLPAAPPPRETPPPQMVMLLPGPDASAPSVAGQLAPAEPQSPRTWAWISLLGGAYLLAVVIVAAARVRRFRRMAGEIRALMPATPAVRALVAQVCHRVGVRRVPELRVSVASAAPFVFGLLRPVLVLSRRQLRDPAELEAVILHEIAHVRRGDMLVRLLQCVATTLFFFWPVVAWVNRRLDLAREVACDEWALRHGPLSAPEYARCLLRAVRHDAADEAALYPAAMAANPSHVERRIEMILESADFRRLTGRRIARGTGLLLAGWSGFVLSGAAEPPAQDTPPAEAPAVIAFQWQDADGVNVECEDILIHTFDELPGLDGVAFGEGHTAVFIADGEGSHNFSFRLEPSAAMLEHFAQNHPSADANGDGLVSVAERDAYLVAIALADPARVLEQYPAADRNADGLLDADEAVRLVTGDLPVKQMLRFRPHVVSGETPVAIAEAGDHHIVVHRMNNAGGEASATLTPGVRIVRKSTSDEGATIELEMHMNDAAESTAGAAAVPPIPPVPSAPPAHWLPANIDYRPAAQEVARYVDLAAAAPLKALLERHPQADTNGDGVLTAAERDAFVEQQSAGMRRKLLERFPEADADGDGNLTHEELMQHFKSRGPQIRARAGGPESTSDSTFEVEIRTAGPEGPDR